MSQRISSPVSATPSRLPRIRSTAAYAGAGRAAPGGSAIVVARGGQIRLGEGRWQQPGELAGPGVGVDQQAQATRLEQELPAPPAWEEALAVSGHHAHPGQRAPAGRVQL